MFLIEPTKVLVPLTDCCNLTCKYCYEPKDKFVFMSKETAKKILDMMFSNLDVIGNRVINIFGGEPTLNLEVLEFIIDYYTDYKHKGKHMISFLINTNLQLVNEDVIRIFRKYKYNAKTSFIVSIDGVKKINDKYRFGRNKKLSSFDKIINNMDILKKNIKEIKFNSNSVITEELSNNYELLKESIVFLCDNFENSTITPTLPGTFSGVINIENLTNVFFDLGGNKNPKLKSMFRNFIPEEGVDNIRKGNLEVCRAGDALLLVDVNGDIYPCDLYLTFKDKEKYSLCNINNIDEFPIKIDKDNSWIKYQRINEKYYLSYIDFKNKSGKDCSKCEYSNACNPCIAYNDYHGDIHTMELSVCESIQNRLKTITHILKSRES